MELLVVLKDSQVLVGVTAWPDREHGQDPLYSIHLEADSPVAHPGAVLVRHTFQAPNVAFGQTVNRQPNPFAIDLRQPLKSGCCGLADRLPPLGRLAQPRSLRLTSGQSSVGSAAAARTASSSSGLGVSSSRGAASRAARNALSWS